MRIKFRCCSSITAEDEIFAKKNTRLAIRLKRETYLYRPDIVRRYEFIALNDLMDLCMKCGAFGVCVCV